MAGQQHPRTVVYGVHLTEWSSVSETLLLTTDLAKAEQYAKARSAPELTLGAMAVVTARELDVAEEVRVLTVWANGQRVADHGPGGMWRKTNSSPV